MNNKQLHVLFGVLCMLAMPLAFAIIAEMHRPGNYILYAVITITVVAIVNQGMMFAVFYEEKTELSNKIGMGYLLFTVVNVIFIAFCLFESAICAILLVFGPLGI